MRRGVLQGLARTWLPLSALLACGNVADSSDPTVITHVEPSPGPPRNRPSSPPPSARVETVPLTIIDLGSVTPGDVARFTIPPGTLGFNVTVEGNGVVGVQTLRSPSGELVTDAHRPVGGVFPSSQGSAGIAAASVPQNLLGSASPPQTGEWEAVFSGSAPLHATVRAQVAPGGAFSGGVLDLHVYIPTGLRMRLPTALHLVTPESAPTDEAIEARLTSFFSGLQSLFGIRRGEVFFHGIDERFLNISDVSQLDELYAQSAVVADTQAMHVMLVRSLIVDPGHPLIGRAAAIPGPATRTGTPQSGVAMTILDGSTPETDALVLLHEAGHFFGLNHTSEMGGAGFDPLDDTPQCANMTLDTMPDCPDAHNLMFPAASWSGLQVSPGQRAVVMGSPIYRLLRAPADPPVASFRENGNFERGGLFGHTGDLTRVDRMVLATMCGNAPLAAPRAFDAATRSGLAAIADNSAAAEATRVAARRMLREGR
jgi:hypothetical protein